MIQERKRTAVYKYEWKVHISLRYYWKIGALFEEWKKNAHPHADEGSATLEKCANISSEVNNCIKEYIVYQCRESISKLKKY